MVTIVITLNLSGKKRLSSLLTAQQRYALILFLFERMLRILTGCTIYIATPDDLECEHAIIPDRWRDINTVLSCAQKIIHDDLIILPCDLPFVERNHIHGLMAECVTIVPSQDEGTNALYIPRDISFKTQFGKNSFQKHITLFESQHIPYQVMRNDKFRDIDSEDDISWALAHEQDSEFSHFWHSLLKKN
jgi:2-phospho-L-lactate guanylyltransferase (CobY/MobA/RfbA family)